MISRLRLMISPRMNNQLPMIPIRHLLVCKDEIYGYRHDSTSLRICNDEKYLYSFAQRHITAFFSFVRMQNIVRDTISLPPRDCNDEKHLYSLCYRL
ncbi:MAG: hypothetical protein K0Q73_1954 [Paenibacillus sp.]|jgi:hypothetical protein|nr:hypothetical protein [Paenibacillus sp.]